MIVFPESYPKLGYKLGIACVAGALGGGISLSFLEGGHFQSSQTFVDLFLTAKPGLVGSKHAGCQISILTLRNNDKRPDLDASY